MAKAIRFDSKFRIVVQYLIQNKKHCLHTTNFIYLLNKKHFLFLQELVVDVAVVTSFRDADLS